MDQEVNRIGLTQLCLAEEATGEPARASIVFFHGLWGHPQKTWEAHVTTSTSKKAADKNGPEEIGITRKGSILPWKKNQPGFPDASRPGLARAATTTSTFTAQSSDSASVISKVTTADSRVEPLRTISEPTRSVISKKVYWPKDLLKKDVPDADIYTYGYDADVIGMSWSDSTSKLTFTQIGQNMLMDLHRGLPPDIPVILCAHSLGGIMVKEVLWQSKTNIVEAHRRLHKQTKCVMFFGTPHRGSKMAGWAGIGLRLVKMARNDVKQTLVESLNTNSEILDRIQNDFQKMLHTGDFYVHVFQEGKPMFEQLGNLKVVEDHSSKLESHPNMTWEVIDGNHRKMVQFKSANDSGYRQITGSLRAYMRVLSDGHDTERETIASNFSAEHLPNRIIFSVPYRRNKDFIGREMVIESIEQRFSGPSALQFAVLYGLGGIGKTQIAIELAHRWKALNRTVIWVYAANSDTFDKSFREASAALGIRSTPDIDHRGVVENWLRKERNGPWLMIIDNVDDANVIFDSSDEEPSSSKTRLLSCIPEVDQGSVLFTTRSKVVASKITGKGPNHVELGQMAPKEGRELLKSYLGSSYEESNDVDELLRELGHIPLAITHAAALMNTKEWSISDYLESYQSSENDKVEMLRSAFEAMGISHPNDSSSDKDNPVLRTWLVSFDHVQADGETGPLASEILSVMSFLDRQHIPRYLFDNFRPGTLSAQYLSAFGTLKGFSMVTQTGVRDRTRFSMHRIVQLSMRGWLRQKGTSDKYTELALEIVSEHFPDNAFKKWEMCDELIVHAESVLEFASASSSNSPARERLLEKVARFQDMRGQYAASKNKWREIVRLRTERDGADHLDTMKANDSLALVLRNESKYDEAMKIVKQTLAEKAKTLGKDHEETLQTAHLAATITGDRGKHQEAEKLHRENYDARKKLLGEDHLDTLKSASSLSLELWELGRFVEAEELARNTWEARKDQLGEEHRDTLEIAGTLGFILECSGKLMEAEELKQDMLEMRKVTYKHRYGPNHPDTADSEHDVGWILHQLGRYDEAEPHYVAALDSKRRLLGEDHPKTLTTKCNLPVFYCDKGEYQRAEEHSRAIIQAFKRKQGASHPQTLDATGGLAVILRHRGKLVEAARAARTSIDGRERVIGKDHPWTWPPKSHWGYILTLQGNLTKGEEIIRTALAGLESNLGEDHPYVLISLLFLSKNLLLQGGPEKLEEAESLARRALEARQAALGEEHPYTYKALWQVARVLSARENFVNAVDLCTEARNGMDGTLGSRHPDVVKIGQDLIKMKIFAGMIDEDEDAL